MVKMSTQASTEDKSRAMTFYNSFSLKNLSNKTFMRFLIAVLGLCMAENWLYGCCLAVSVFIQFHSITLSSHSTLPQNTAKKIFSHRIPVCRSGGDRNENGKYDNISGCQTQLG